MRYVYKDIHNYGRPFVNIHPYKQAAVKHMVDNVYDWIECVIIFGGATQPYCWDGSDIDVCIIGSAPDEFNSRALRTNGQAFDFLLYASYEDLVEASKVSSQNVALDIIEGGVVVYAKESDIAG